MAGHEDDEFKSAINTSLTAAPNPIELQKLMKTPRLRRSKSLVSLPVQRTYTDGCARGVGETLDKSLCYTPLAHSLTKFLGSEVNEERFYKEVARKTQTHMIGRQEAETEVVIDRLIDKEGSKDKALLFVVSEMHPEPTVLTYANALLNRGAHPSVCDSHWRTPLHHAVHRDLKDVVSKLLEYDALPHVRDKEQLMPFHLALQAEDDEVCSMLLKRMSNDVVRLLFVACDDKPAECSFHHLIDKNMQQSCRALLDCMVDKIGQTRQVQVFYQILESDDKGRPPDHRLFDKDSMSCLQTMSKRGEKDLVYHFVVRLLIRRKWKSFARLRFQLNAILYLFNLVALTFSAVVAADTSEPTEYKTPLQVARAVVESWCLIVAVATFLVELNQMRRHSLEYWRDQFNWIDLGSSACLAVVGPLRFLDVYAHWQVFAVGYLLWTLRIFKFAAIFRQTGAYAQILWRVISHDFFQFMILFLVILLAFSCSFLLVLRGENSLDVHSETSSFWRILLCGVRILIEAEPVVEYTGNDGYKPFSSILMIVFLFVCCVVLLNILIAQLSDTYQNVQSDAQRGLELNRAWIITRVERYSLFTGDGFRVSKYLEKEDIANPYNILENWKTPILNDIGRILQDVKEGQYSTNLHLQTVKNRLSRQEYALSSIQNKLETVCQELQTKSNEPK